jgi:hypothetical protein
MKERKGVRYLSNKNRRNQEDMKKEIEKLRSREDQENTRKSERNTTTRIVETNEFNTPDLRINLTTRGYGITILLFKQNDEKMA